MDNEIRPYGDHLDDGIVHVAFTLPCANKAAALRIAELMGLMRAEIVHKQPLTGEHTYFLLYGHLGFGVDPKALPTAPDPQHMTADEIERLGSAFGRPIRVVGATTGTDTHSVGLDSILNLKGYHGHHGLEGYACFDVHNLGSQVSNTHLLDVAASLGADVILVSQTVTQQDLHVANLQELVAMGPRATVLMCGGARMSDEQARELGFDAGFGKGTYPHHVATRIVRLMSERRTDLMFAEATRRAA